MIEFTFKSGNRAQQIPVVDVVEGEDPDSDEGTMEDDGFNEVEAAMEDLSFIAFGDGRAATTEGGLNIARIHWSQSMEELVKLGHRIFESLTLYRLQKNQLQRRGYASRGCPASAQFRRATTLSWVRIAFCNITFKDSSIIRQLKQASTVSRLMTLQIESGYYSNLHRTRDALIFGELNQKTSSVEAEGIEKRQNAKFESYKEVIGDPQVPAGRRPHPFSIHLVLLFKGVLARNEEVEEALRKMLLLEDRSIYRRSKVTFESGDDTKRRLQELHSLFQEMLIRKGSNQRYMAIADSLIRDLDRLQKAVQSTRGALPIEEYEHQRMLDGFQCLKSFCLDRECRLETRLQRVQNLIALVGESLPSLIGPG
ncbi:MAG: hypothetical protein Q9186_006877 [Xanthomendoza sp. 1 TL-2023]